MKVGRILLLSVAMLIMLSTVVMGQPQGYPVDIPGTDVNFFLYRYESDTPPYDEINAIWDQINQVLREWVASGQDPATLTVTDVSVQTTKTKEIAVFLKDTLIVVADEFHSKLNHASPQQLAEIWADNLREGVAAFVRINSLRP